MKKFLIFLLICFLTALTVSATACNGGEELHCYVPDGAPALAVANIIKSGKVGSHKVTTTVTTGENVMAKCQNGEADIALLPTNAAVKICSARQEYCFFSVNVQGLLFVMGTEQVQSLAELKGQKVHSIGLGNTPEYVFKKILDVNGVDYSSSGGINFEYVTDGSTVIPLMLQGKAKFAVLGEPAATSLMEKAAAKGKTVYRLFDLQQLWQQATNSDAFGYPQAGIVIKRALLQNADFEQAFTQMVFANAEFLQNNVDALSELMQGAGSSLKIAYTSEILARCNLTAVTAISAKADIEKYLSSFGAMQSMLPLNDSIFYEKTN